MKNVVGMESKDNEFPVFKSDIMAGTNDSIPAVSGVGSVGSIAPISGAASSIDSIAIWRQMSENYRRIRLEKE